MRICLKKKKSPRRRWNYIAREPWTSHEQARTARCVQDGSNVSVTCWHSVEAALAAVLAKTGTESISANDVLGFRTRVVSQGPVSLRAVLEGQRLLDCSLELPEFVR